MLHLNVRNDNDGDELWHMYICCVLQGIIKIPFERDCWFWCHSVPNLLNYTHANNYFGIKGFNKVIVKINRCRFLHHIVVGNDSVLVDCAVILHSPCSVFSCDCELGRSYLLLFQVNEWTSDRHCYWINILWAILWGPWLGPRNMAVWVCL